MAYIIRTLTLTVLLTIYVDAQDFSVTSSPATINMIAGDTTRVTLSFSTRNGFSSSIFLSSTSKVKLDFSSMAINPPYHDVTVVLRPTINDTGTSVIVFTGESLGISSTTVCTATVSKAPAWRVMEHPAWDMRATSSLLDEAGHFTVYARYFAKTTIYSYASQQWNATQVNLVKDANHRSTGGYSADGTAWIGTSSGMYKLYSGDLMLFNTDNSSLPSNNVVWSDVDHNQKAICITQMSDGVSHSLSRFNGSDWVIENNLQGVTLRPDSKFTVDSSNIVWGLDADKAKMFKTIDSTYTFMSDCTIIQLADIVTAPNGYVYCLEGYEGVDKSVYIFDGSNCSKIDVPTQRTGESLKSIASDDANGIWVGTSDGLYNYDQGSWTSYTASNSPLPKGSINQITIDGSGNIWLMMTNDVIVFNPNGLVGIPRVQITEVPTQYSGNQIDVSPNPASTLINVVNSAETDQVFRVYNVSGTLVLTRSIPGGSTNRIDVSLLSNGVYVCNLGLMYSRLLISR